MSDAPWLGKDEPGGLYEQGMHEESEKIVAWLRSYRDGAALPDTMMWSILDRAIRLIEADFHHRKNDGTG